MVGFVINKIAEEPLVRRLLAASAASACRGRAAAPSSKVDREKHRSREERTWTPSTPRVGKPRSNQSIRELAEHHSVAFSKMKKQLRRQDAEANLFINDTYQVDMRPVPAVANWPELTWLSIKRLDRAPVGAERFRDFQQIKNMLCGEGAEAIEIYPAESRLVDTCNQYHLWVIDGRFPLGFPTRAVSYQGVGGAVQKPL